MNELLSGFKKESSVYRRCAMVDVNQLIEEGLGEESFENLQAMIKFIQGVLQITEALQNPTVQTLAPDNTTEFLEKALKMMCSLEAKFVTV
jgi:hypothetical protein